MTCHLLTARFEVKRFTLSTRDTPEGYPAITIVISWDQPCVDWEIQADCMRYTLTDNRRSIRVAARKPP